MKIEFDPNKNARNVEHRDLSFESAAEFDWGKAIYREDVRKPYAERRFIAVGNLGDRVHVLCFTPIEGGVRIISFRKANHREVKRYEKENARTD